MAHTGWEPEPVGGGLTLLEAITGVGLLALAVCGATFIVLAAPTRTAGATRSAMLEWQQRQQQVEAAVGEQQAPEADHAAADVRP